MKYEPTDLLLSETANIITICFDYEWNDIPNLGLRKLIYSIFSIQYFISDNGGTYTMVQK